MAVAILRRPGFPLAGGTSDAVLFPSPAQCTRREAAGIRFGSRMGGTSGPSVPVRYAVSSRVFNNSGPDGSRDRAVARMRGQVLGFE